MKKYVVLLCILWLGFIFYNSSKTGVESNAKSFTITNMLRAEVRKERGESSMKYTPLPSNAKEESFNLFIRKNAHAFEYCVLAILACGVLFSLNLKGKNAVIYILFICLLYAVLDEFHQIYVPGRTSSVRDVLIDFAGSILGMLAFYFTYYKILRKK
ncbi:MAG: VanZ family protein [Bacillota bacterium]|nr:VanZ family protein [Bacillota bacterium]